MNEDILKGIISDFLLHCHENLDYFEKDLLSLEEGDQSDELLNTIFRGIHSIKGTAGSIGFVKIDQVTHNGENLLDLVRKREIEISSDLISALLKLSDCLREILRHIEADGTEGTEEYDELISTLKDLQSGEAPAPAKTTLESEPVSQASLPTHTDAKSSQLDNTSPPPHSHFSGGKKDNDESQNWGIFDDEDLEAEHSTTPKAKPAPSPPSPAPVEEEKEDEQNWGLFDDEDDAADGETYSTSAAIEAALPGSKASQNSVATQEIEHNSPKPPPISQEGKSVADSAIRVGIDQLDNLMNLVGELVLARNQIMQYTTDAEDTKLVAASQRLNLITTELQESVMKTRMLPIENVWSKFPRVIRDLSMDLGKEVELIMEGQETELDRTIIEGIKDPLTHLIRNSVDHGIEMPDDREAIGKPRKGSLTLRAFHEGGQVNIEITDDGAGINVQKVKDKAVYKGIISAEHAASMDDREAHHLIFEPGFSTATEVTSLSGRGVGMDVVKTNIERIGGSVEIRSEAGISTSLNIKIPLTLAIIPALIITSSGERFAIPQVSLVELVRLEDDDVEKNIEEIYGAPVFRLRGNFLPLVFLNKELKLGTEDISKDGVINIVVMQADGRQFGLVVDQINDTEEIVVKPLGKQLKGLRFFAGGTIMGDGKVALILDAIGLGQHAHVISAQRESQLMEDADQSDKETKGSQIESFLLFDNGPGTRLAINLDRVARLEEFPADKVEKSCGEEMIQYRGQVMPLVRIENVIPSPVQGMDMDLDPDSEEDSANILRVIVCDAQGQAVGLVVRKINDIVEEHVETRSNIPKHGLQGSVVLQEKVTALVDIDRIFPPLTNTAAGTTDSRF